MYSLNTCRMYFLCKTKLNLFRVKCGTVNSINFIRLVNYLQTLLQSCKNENIFLCILTLSWKNTEASQQWLLCKLQPLKKVSFRACEKPGKADFKDRVRLTKTTAHGSLARTTRTDHSGSTACIVHCAVWCECVMENYNG